MASSDLVRWGGLVAMLGGVLWLIGALIDLVTGASSQAPGSPSFTLVEGILSIAFIGTLAGIIGLHARQVRSYGRLGLSGSLVAFIGVVLMFVAGVATTLMGREALDYSQVLDSLFFLGFLVAFVGFVLLGVATLRARVLPRWCGVLLIVFLPVVGVLGAALGDFGAGLVQGLTWLALGYVLWSQRGATAEQPTRVR